MRILLVDDDSDLLDRLSQTLKDQRYEVDTAADGDLALEKLFDHVYDLVLLDIMLPKTDGLTILKELRQAKIKTPVIMLTARVTVEDKIRGLDHGADDYLAKPFAISELFARIRSLLRRAGEEKDMVLSCEDISLNTKTRAISKNGVAVDLTPKEFSILEFLLYNKNQVVPRVALAEHIWGDEFDPFTMSNFMDVHVKNLRHKLGDKDNKKVIRTVRGVGFTVSDSHEQNAIRS
jgi:DNA-binding response OmpR family regulator